MIPYKLLHLSVTEVLPCKMGIIKIPALWVLVLNALDREKDQEGRVAGIVHCPVSQRSANTICEPNLACCLIL